LISVVAFALSLVGIGRWRALIQPIFELMEASAQGATLQKWRGPWRIRLRPIPVRTPERIGATIPRRLPGSDRLASRAGANPLDRQPDAVRRLVALAVASASLGRFERGE
jgi:hypothetical protein